MLELDEMLKNLPAAYRGDKWVRDLLGAVAVMDDTQRKVLLDAAAQIFPDSMTWVLENEERMAGITAAETMEERRTALISRWRGAGKCDVDLIQRVCDSWQNGEISVGFAAGVVVLTFVGAYGVPEAAALAALKDAVEHTIPCHLATEYLYRYLLVREVEGMTLETLQGHTMRDFAF